MAESTALLTSRDVEGLRRLARGLLGGDAGMAEDAVQDAWIVANGKPTRLGVAWLAGFVKNRARQLLRSDRRTRARLAHASPGALPREPLDHVAALEEQRGVLAALQALAEPYRHTLWLHFFGARTPAEIAAEHGIPAATVRTRLKRGLALLRERLDADHRGDRRAWTSALLPFAYPRTPGPGVTGFLAGPRAIPWVAAALGAVLLGAVVLGVHLGQGPSAPATGATHDAASSGPVLLTQGRAPERPAEPEAATTWRGRIVDPDGKPVAGAWVYAVDKARPPGEHQDPEPCVRTDTDGAFAFALPRGLRAWIVVAPPATSPWARRVVDAEDDAQRQRADWPLGPASRARVRVTTAAGEPLWGAYVEMLPVEPDLTVPWPGPREPLLGSDHVVRLPGVGEFEVQRADDLPRWLRVKHLNAGTHEGPLEAGDGVQHVRLGASAELRVRVESGATGALVKAATATVERLGLPIPAETYELEVWDRILLLDSGVAPGRHRLLVSAPGHRPHEEDLVVTRAGAAIERVVRLVPVAAGRLNVRASKVRETECCALTRGTATVFLRSRENPGSAWTVRAVARADDGTLTVEELASGPYEVFVLDGARWAHVVGVDVPAGGTAEIDPTWVDATRVRMPRVARGRDGDRAEVVQRDGTTLPLYRWDGAGASLYDDCAWPVAGARVGPYPPDAGATLRIRRADGAVEVHPLPADGS